MSRLQKLALTLLSALVALATIAFGVLRLYTKS